MAVKIYESGTLIAHESTNDNDLNSRIFIRAGRTYYWPKNAFFYSYDSTKNEYSISRFNGVEEFNIANSLVFSDFARQNGTLFTTNDELRGYLNNILGDPEVIIDDLNSSTTLLTSGSVFTGESIDTGPYGIIFINIYSDVASATNGLSIEQSSDGVNWDHNDVYTVPAATGKNYSINPYARYLRVVYTNGGSNQSEFRLQTILKSNAKPSSHRIQDAISDDDDAELVKAILTGKANGNYVNVLTTQDGNLTISDNSSGLAIAEGNVTGATFVHKFGDAPDFDTGDNEVTIWDGANDALLSGGAMAYTYSAGADIGLLSSSNGGDSQDIEIQGLLADGTLSTQTFTLNGQTDVDLSATGTDFKRVFRMKNVGATNIAGVVYLRTNGSGQASGVPSTANTVRAIINGANNQTLMAVYTIPTGKTGYMRSFFASSAGAKKDTNYVIKVKARPAGQVFQIKHKTALVAAGTSHFQHEYVEPEVFTAGTDIEMTAQITEATITEADIAAGFDIVLIDD